MIVKNPSISIDTNPSTLSMLSYMSANFRHWKFHGFINNEDDYKFGLDLDSKNLLAVYSKEYSVIPESDTEDKEQELIDQGMTSIILFKGSDNTSYMRRMTPEQLDKYVVESYIHENLDLWYNS